MTKNKKELGEDYGAGTDTGLARGPSSVGTKIKNILKDKRRRGEKGFMVRESSGNKKARPMEASLTGDRIHFAGQMLNLIFSLLSSPSFSSALRTAPYANV